MKRRVLIIAGLAAIAALAVALVANGRAGSASSGYRVDAIFDQARGLIPGQLVEVAGGRVGKIDDVTLTPDFKARIAMTVQRQFAPFRTDATCTIRPQGLIAENFVQCDPGTQRAPELRGAPPTVPVAHTSEPVSLTDLFEIWNVPTRDRLGVLISELGVSTAARGADINAILRRANPSLALARRLIAVLERQRAQLLGAVDDSSAVLARLAPHAPGTRRLIEQAAAVLTRTGLHAADLSTAIARLPGLLHAARPALRTLDSVAASGTPLLAQIHRSAPALVALTHDAPALASAAGPGLARIAPVLDRGAGTVRRATPLGRALRVYAHQALPAARTAGTLFPNLRDTGFIANLMRFFYYATAATARFDATSHILPAHVIFSPCSSYATAPAAGCSADYTQPAAAAAARRRTRAVNRVLRYLLG